MSGWTVHLPPQDGGSRRAEDFVLVKDGFRPSAFLFGPLWFLAKRLWWGGLAAGAADAATWWAQDLLGLPYAVAVVMAALLHALYGLEGATVERWTLARRGWIEFGAVVAQGKAEAEIRATSMIDGLFGPGRASEVAASTATAWPPPPSPVLGLFPEARR